MCLDTATQRPPGACGWYNHAFPCAPHVHRATLLFAVNDQKVLNRNNAQAWEDVRVQLHKTPLFRGKRISANSLQRRLAAVMASTQKRQSLRLAKEACGIEEVAAPWHGLAEALYAERQRCRKNKQSARVSIACCVCGCVLCAGLHV